MLLIWVLKLINIEVYPYYTQQEKKEIVREFDKRNLHMRYDDLGNCLMYTFIFNNEKEESIAKMCWDEINKSRKK